MSEQKQRKEDDFTAALSKIAKASSEDARAAVEASKSTKPSLHTRFVYSPAEGRD
jgi:hypothetical protein